MVGGGWVALLWTKGRAGLHFPSTSSSQQMSKVSHLRLTDQYLEMPLSHTAQIDAVFLSQVYYGVLVSQEPFPYAPALWCS